MTKAAPPLPTAIPPNTADVQQAADVPQIGARQAWMGLLARARPDRLAALITDLPDHSVLRPAEVGAVMVRGRVGAIGAPFNLGEMSVTRCSVRLAAPAGAAAEVMAGAAAGGAVGHAYVQGRDRDHARRAAVVDALMQTGQAGRVQAVVLDVLAADEAARRRARAEKAAATKVDFFTLVRGSNA